MGLAMACCSVREFVRLFFFKDVEFIVSNCLGCSESWVEFVGETEALGTIKDTFSITRE
jgi:hypothetical protein